MFQGAERIGFEFTELHRSLRKSRNCYSDLGFKRWGEGWAIVGALSVGGVRCIPPIETGVGGPSGSSNILASCVSNHK